ncbi:MAG: hypothetical protein GX823_00850, partial [Clostridiales bacterium]|nr:hypothetical protein [Clostridiales bacterium]
VALLYDESVLGYLFEKSFSTVYGARNLGRTIQKEIEDAIASEIIDGFGRTISQIGITTAEGELQIIAI